MCSDFWVFTKPRICFSFIAAHNKKYQTFEFDWKMYLHSPYSLEIFVCASTARAYYVCVYFSIIRLMNFFYDQVVEFFSMMNFSTFFYGEVELFSMIKLLKKYLWSICWTFELFLWSICWTFFILCFHFIFLIQIKV